MRIDSLGPEPLNISHQLDVKIADLKEQPNAKKMHDITEFLEKNAPHIEQAALSRLSNVVRKIGEKGSSPDLKKLTDKIAAVSAKREFSIRKEMLPNTIKNLLKQTEVGAKEVSLRHEEVVEESIAGWQAPPVSWKAPLRKADSEQKLAEMEHEINLLKDDPDNQDASRMVYNKYNYEASQDLFVRIALEAKFPHLGNTDDRLNKISQIPDESPEMRKIFDRSPELKEWKASVMESLMRS